MVLWHEIRNRKSERIKIMNKTQLIDVVANKTGLKKKDADAAVAAVLEAIEDALKSGEKVQLNGVKFASEKIDDINYLTVDFYVKAQKKTVTSFISQTFKTTLSNCVVVYRSLIDLITGRYGISAMSGPVGVTAVIGNAARENLLNIIPIMALITINLGLFNLLPIPALDGGRLVFILFEMIFRKKVPQKYEAAVHAVGMALLLLLMAVVSFKDIWMLITG